MPAILGAVVPAGINLGLHGIQEVVGSIPISSTLTLPKSRLATHLPRQTEPDLPWYNRSVRGIPPRTRLPLGLETVAQVMEQTVDGPRPHGMPRGLQGRGSLGRTLTGPPQH